MLRKDTAYIGSLLEADVVDVTDVSQHQIGCVRI